LKKGAPEIAHPSNREAYEYQLSLITAWFFEMWERIGSDDEKAAHEARVELQTLFLNFLGQLLRLAYAKKGSATNKWAGATLASVGVSIGKHDLKLVKANAAYREEKEKLAGKKKRGEKQPGKKSLASVFFPKWIGQIVQRELKETERYQKHLLLLKTAYGKKWKKAAKRESIPEAYYATVHLPELRKKKFQDNTKAQVYLEKTKKRWWKFLWPLISKKIKAKLPKVKQSYKHSGTLYPSRYDTGAREHLDLFVCLRVKGVL
jgi:hypothetical protein